MEQKVITDVRMDVFLTILIPRRRLRDINLALSVRLFVQLSVRHKLVWAISQRLLNY